MVAVAAVTVLATKQTDSTLVYLVNDEKNKIKYIICLFITKK